MAVRQVQELVGVTTELVREFGGVLEQGSVVRCVDRCRDELVRAGVSAGLPTALTAMARLRLRHQATGQPCPTGAGSVRCGCELAATG